MKSGRTRIRFHSRGDAERHRSARVRSCGGAAARVGSRLWAGRSFMRGILESEGDFRLLL